MFGFILQSAIYGRFQLICLRFFCTRLPIKEKHWSFMWWTLINLPDWWMKKICQLKWLSKLNSQLALSVGWTMYVYTIDRWLASLIIHWKWNLLQWCNPPTGLMRLPGSIEVKPPKPYDEAVWAKYWSLHATLTTWVNCPRYPRPDPWYSSFANSFYQNSITLSLTYSFLYCISTLLPSLKLYN